MSEAKAPVAPLMNTGKARALSASIANVEAATRRCTCESMNTDSATTAVNEKEGHGRKSLRVQYPRVSVVPAGCAEAVRLVPGMAAFDRGEIHNFEVD